MRRWNGWGDDATTVAPPPALLALLEDAIGPGAPPRDVTLDDVLRAVPPPRLAAHPMIDAGAEARLRHARGQSLPDLIALRSGSGLAYPDGVARPASDAEVAALLAFARAHDADVIPYGGGTSVVGHVNPRPGPRPVLTVSLARMAALRGLDTASRLAAFGAGIAGPALESALAREGFTLGHFPQSFELSTLGGWVATRSSGQQSLGYGRIEDLFAGGTLVAPAGVLALPPFPASAAGPDLRHLVLGSEGRLGIVTEAVVRVTPRPEVERFAGFLFPSWEDALAGARALAQSGIPLSMVRVSAPEETATNAALASRGRLAAAVDWALRLRGVRAPGRCLALVGASGARGPARASARAAASLLRGHRAIGVGAAPGRSWQRNRFRAPYLRNTLWEAGYAVDTVETATTWSRVAETRVSVEGALRGALAAGGERVHAFTHLSHVYATGASVYSTFVFRLARDPAATLARWRALKDAASSAIAAAGGTISHQHGVGEDHARHLAREKGELGMKALGGVLRSFDEAGMLNPGKLVAGGD